MTVFWDFDEKHPNKLVLMGLRHVFSAHARWCEGHPSCFNLVLSRPALVVCKQIDAEEGQGALVRRVHDVRSKDVAFTGIDLDFAGEVSELAETD